MKKLFLLTMIGCMLSSGLFAQQCIENAWMSLKNSQIGKAKKAIDECMPGNETNAEVWLMKANVYIQLYYREAERLEKDPSYVSHYTDAALIANECFLKALELDLKVQPRTGMLGAIEGQILCASPLLDMGYKAMGNKNWEDAIKYLNDGAKNLKLDKTYPDLELQLGLIYRDVAIIAHEGLNNDTEYQKALQEAIKIKTPIPYPYYSMYEVYREANDTLNCKKILDVADKIVPDSATKYFDALELINLQVKSLDYYGLTNNIEKLIELANKMASQTNNVDVLSIIAGQLNNIGQYEQAEPIILKGLAIDSNSFDLNQQMAYRYYYVAAEYDKQIDNAKMVDRDYEKANQLTETQKGIFENAHIWLEKSYKLNADDRQNNIMLNQVKLRLRKPVPPELKEKVDSYLKKN